MITPFGMTVGETILSKRKSQNAVALRKPSVLAHLMTDC